MASFNGVEHQLLEIEYQALRNDEGRDPSRVLVDVALGVAAKTCEEQHGLAACACVLNRADYAGMLGPAELEQLAEHADDDIKTIAWGSPRTPQHVLETALKDQLELKGINTGRRGPGKHWRILAENRVIVHYYVDQLVDAMGVWADNGLHEDAAILGGIVVMADETSVENAQKVWEIVSESRWVREALEGTGYMQKRTGNIYQTLLGRRIISFGDIVAKGTRAVAVLYTRGDLELLEEAGILSDEDWKTLARTILGMYKLDWLLHTAKGRDALVAVIDERPEWLSYLPESLRGRVQITKTLVQEIEDETDPEKLAAYGASELQLDEIAALVKNVNTPYELAVNLAYKLPKWVAYTARNDIDWKAGCLYVGAEGLVPALRELMLGDDKIEHQTMLQLGEPLDITQVADDTSQACLQVLRWVYKNETTGLNPGAVLRLDVVYVDLIQENHWKHLPWRSLVEASACNSKIAAWVGQVTEPLLADEKLRSLLFGIGDDWNGSISELVDTCKRITEQDAA